MRCGAGLVSGPGADARANRLGRGPRGRLRRAHHLCALVPGLRALGQGGGNEEGRLRAPSLLELGHVLGTFGQKLPDIRGF
jgi:hypothetical protein